MKNICPNINSPEWKALEEKVGKYEALKDWMEHDGVIRTPEQVLSKLREKNMGFIFPGEAVSKVEKVEELVIPRYQESFLPTANTTEIAKSQAIVFQVADKLSQKLGVEYETITAEKAIEITSGTKNVWNGQKAFFLGGKVYFVGNVDFNTQFHEFAHPFVRALIKTNRELMLDIYNKFIQTPEGQQILEETSQEYDTELGSDIVIEEVLVKAIQLQASYNQKNITPSNWFTNLMTRLFTGLKAMIRKAFGVNDVSKINTNTTLYDLAEMLLSDEQFEIDPALISEEDIVAYNSRTKEFVEDVMRAEPTVIKKIVEDMYKKVSFGIRGLKQNRDLFKNLVDEYNRGDLWELSTNVADIRRNLEKSLELNKETALEIINSLERVDAMMGRITDHIKEMNQDLSNLDKKQNIDYINRLVYYENFINYWIEFTNSTMVGLEETGMKPSDPVYGFVNQIKRNLEIAKKEVKGDNTKGYMTGVSKVLWDQWRDLGEKIDKSYQERLAKLRSTNASPEIIEELHVEYYGLTQAEKQKYDELKSFSSLTDNENSKLKELRTKMFKRGVILTEEKVNEALKGELGDMNFLSSMLEGYMYQDDVVIGGFALFVRNTLNDINTTVFRKYNDQTKELDPLLKAVGYNKNDIGKLGRELGFIDVIGKVDDLGNMVEKQVWRFLNPHKGHDFYIDKARNEINKAREKYNKTKSDEDLNALNALKDNFEKHLKEHFHRPLTDAFYAKDRIFEGSPEGIEAKRWRDEWIEKLNDESDPSRSFDDENIAASRMQALWIEYKGAHSFYDKDGNLKDEFGIKVAKKLQDYRELTGKFYDEVKRKGVFENALKDYQEKLITIDNLDPTSEEFKAKVDEWINSHTRIRLAKTDAGEVIYYKELEEKIATLRELEALIPESELDQKASKIIENIVSISKMYKDDDGAPNGSIMPQELIKKVKELTQELNRLKDDKMTLKGLTRKEKIRLNALYTALENGNTSVAGEINSLRLKARMARKELGLGQGKKNDMLLKRYTAILKEIADMSDKNPTEYYMDILNDKIKNIPGISADFITKVLGEENNEITPEKLELLYSNLVLDELFKLSPEFETWFKDNHILNTRYDSDLRTYMSYWQRLDLWTVKTPSEDRFYEQTEIVYADGTKKTINRIPDRRYTRKIIKDSYIDANGRTVKLKTDKIIGVTVNNKREWLPKASSDLYRNEEYYRLKNADPNSRDGKLFTLLEKMKEIHLQNQDRKPMRSRLYLDYPRYMKTFYEAAKTQGAGTVARSRFEENFPLIHYMWKRIKEWKVRDKEDGLDTLNPDFQYDLVRVNMHNEEMVNIPVEGLYDLDIEDVSTDIVTNMLSYMASLEKQKKLIEIHPVAKALQNVLNEQGVKDLTKIDKRNFSFSNIISFIKKDDEYIRKRTVDNMVDRDIYGNRNAGMFKDNKAMNTLSKFLFGRASMAMFALNIPAALKDHFGAKFQKMLLTSGGKYVDPKSVALGEIWGTKVMAEFSFGSVSQGVGPQIYETGPKTLDVQLVQLFNIYMENPTKNYIRSASRSVMSDTVGLSWLYNFREWLQKQATTSLFGAMMYKKIVYQNGKPIEYINAWEIRNGQITLKDGIDPDYGPDKKIHVYKSEDTINSIAQMYNIDPEDLKKRLGRDNLDNIKEGHELEVASGKKFKEALEEFQIVQQSLEGNYAEMNQPDAQRYLLFRFVSYLKKYFTTMFINRFGFKGGMTTGILPRYNPGLNDLQMGFYVSTMRNVMKIFKSGGQYFNVMSDTEKKELIKMPLEIAALITLKAMLLPLFGWDEDDDEKYEKLRQKSGALPLPFVAEDKENPFQLMGWLENHALLLAMKVRTENEVFLPAPGFGLDDYSQLVKFQSLAFGPTLDSYFKMAALSYQQALGNDKAYYKRKSGPYIWQEEGGSKFTTTFAKSLGLTGSTVDPANAVKIAVSIENLNQGG